MGCSSCAPYFGYRRKKCKIVAHISVIEGNIDSIRKVCVPFANPVNVRKVPLNQNKRIRPAGLVEGASGAEYGCSDRTVDKIIEKVSVARRH